MEACAMSGTLFPNARQSVLRTEELHSEDVHFAGKNKDHEFRKLCQKFFGVFRKIFG